MQVQPAVQGRLIRRCGTLESVVTSRYKLMQQCNGYTASQADTTPALTFNWSDL